MRHPEHLYHIFPLGALRRPGGGYENLSALSRWIPHLKSLNTSFLHRWQSHQLSAR